MTEVRVPQVMPWIGREEYAAIADCFDQAWITEGPKAAEFQKRLLEIVGMPYGVFAPNGTLALYLGLVAMGIEAGDEVIVPDCTFIASANAVIMAGGTPVFVDVTSTNYQMDASLIESAISPRTKAIMPVHLYGQAANMDAIIAVARAHNLIVIEDAAQALGIRYRDQPCGSFSDVGCFSFFADKSITTGEGGFVVCRDEEIYKRLLLLRNQGRPDRGTFIHPGIGFNFRMTDMQMAVGLAQLDKLPEIVRRKQHILERYQEVLAEIPQVRMTEHEPGSDWVPFRTTILAERAHDLMAFMDTRGVQPRTFFYPLHAQPCFAYLAEDPALRDRMAPERFPNATQGYEDGICLASFPTLSDEQIEYVAETIKAFYRGG